MNLQWALLALGVILVLIVFGVSRYGGLLKGGNNRGASNIKSRMSGSAKVGQKAGQKASLKARQKVRKALHGNQPISRDVDNAPSLGGSIDEDILFDGVSKAGKDGKDGRENMANQRSNNQLFNAPLFDYSDEQEALADDMDTLGLDQDLNENLLLSDTDETIDVKASAHVEKRLREPAHDEAGEPGATLNDDAQKPASEPDPKPDQKLGRATQSVQARKGPFQSLRQIDYWAKVMPATACTQMQIMAELDNLFDQTPFPLQAHALTAGDARWLDLQALPEDQSERSFTEILVSYQLLHKGVATSLSALEDFDERLGVLAHGLAAQTLPMANPAQAREQAIKLEAMFAEASAPIAVSVCAPAGQAFMGKLVETSAKQQGLDYIAGEYVRQKRMGNQTIVLYKMLNDDLLGFSADSSAETVIERVTFTMIPALSKTPGRDVKEMLDSAKAFSSRVKGEIRIPGHDNYHQDQLLKMRDKVSKLERKLKELGLTPGGVEAKRLFN